MISPYEEAHFILVYSRSPVHRDDALRRRRSVSKGAVRPDCVVVFPLVLNHDLSLFQAVKDLAVEQFIPEPGVEALAIAVFPR